MFKIVFCAIGALVGVSLGGFSLGLLFSAGGFMVGILADNKRERGESPHAGGDTRPRDVGGAYAAPQQPRPPGPTATQPGLADPGAPPAAPIAPPAVRVAPGRPVNELMALREEVATLRLQVEHLTIKVNALATGQTIATATGSAAPSDVAQARTAGATIAPPAAPPRSTANTSPVTPPPRPTAAAPAAPVIPGAPVAPTTAAPVATDPQRIAEAEREFQALAAAALPEGHAPTWAPGAQPATALNTPAPSARVQTPARAAARRPQPPSGDGGFNPFAAAWNWLFGGNTLVRVGVVVLFCGLAFLVKFAAENMVFPIELRYLGIAAGAVLAMVIGWRLREKRPGYAMAMQGLAVATLYLTVFAAFRLHQLLPGGLTFALLVGICAFSAALAILQNAVSMAVIGICGGFLAPVLASTGGGSHVALFSYYALLNAGIFAIAWFKAWRPLNVLGFALTFGIGSAWGQRYYRDELFASTEPFLILFFLFYLAIGLMYARRRLAELSQRASLTIGGQQVDYVDGTLVFGVPIAAFGLQYLMVRDMPLGTAFSALGLGAIYLPLAAWLARRGRDEMRLMIESFLALGLIFASLAIPLALDAQWTAASWALEGVGLYWVAARQRKGWVRAFALLLQAGGGVNLLRALSMPGEASPYFGWQTLIAGPALSALMVGASGLAIADLIRRHADRVSENEQTLRPLLALWGLAFAHLVFPILLDQRWTGIAFTLSGCTAVLIGLRVGNMGAYLFGSLVQVMGAALFATTDFSAEQAQPWLNLHLAGFLLIAVAGLISALDMHRHGNGAKTADRAGDERDFARIFAAAGLCWAVGWWWAAFEFEIAAHAGVYGLGARIGLAALTALGLLAIGGRWRCASARVIALALLPALCLFAAHALQELEHPAQALGWLAWPAALATLFLVLRKNEDGPAESVLPGSHGLSLWLATGLLTWQTWWWFARLGDPGSAWPILGWAIAPLVVLGTLTLLIARKVWPTARYGAAYWLAALPIGFGLWFWIFFANLKSPGDAAPLPYLPIANPLDLAVAASLLLLFAATRRTMSLAHRASDETLLNPGVLALGATAFFWLNGVLLRTLHHWAGVPFDFEVMMASTLVQAALSLFWAVIALCLMLFATGRGLRLIWMIGGALMAGVVLKLFLVDLSRVGTIERIVSFIGVGILLLVLGYFSPVPPRRGEHS